MDVEKISKKVSKQPTIVKVKTTKKWQDPYYIFIDKKFFGTHVTETGAKKLVKNKTGVDAIIINEAYSVKTINFKERTLSKGAIKKALELLPDTARHFKSHVAGLGYVIFFRDKDDQQLGELHKDPHHGVQLSVVVSR